MGIRFTRTTREILNHITEYEFITAKQCADIFYADKKQGLIQSQVKLRNLYNEGVLKRYGNRFTKEYIYTLSDKAISEHSIYIMNLYSYIKKNYEIIYSNLKQPTWGMSKCRSDAHIIFNNNKGNTIGILCEVDLFHQTSKSKLDNLYSSGEVQQFYETEYNVSGYFPSVLIINGVGKTNIVSSEYEVVCVDYGFTGLSDILGGN